MRELTMAEIELVSGANGCAATGAGVFGGGVVAGGLQGAARGAIGGLQGMAVGALIGAAVTWGACYLMSDS